MINETCDLGLQNMTAAGSQSEIQKIILKYHGMYYSNNSETSDVWFIKRTQNLQDPKFLNYKGKLQHMPGTKQIANKATFSKLMAHNNYDKYMPKQFVLPDDLPKLEEFARNYTGKFIVKPTHLIQGKGISVANNISQILDMYQINKQNKGSNYDQMVVQEYLQSQIINNRKFDIRVLLTQTSMNPTTVYIYKEALLRFSSVDYNDTVLTNQNADPETLRRMAVTNSHVSQVYIDRTFQATWTSDKYFEYMHSIKPDFSEEDFWSQVYNIVQSIFNEKTVQCEKDNIIKEQQHPSQYFRQIGIDLLPLDNGTLVLLEFNYNPAYTTPFESENKIYKDFFIDMYNLAGIRPINATTNCDKKCKKQFLNSVFDDNLTDDEKIALLQIYDERQSAHNYIPVKPLEETEKVFEYNKILRKYWDMLDNPFNNQTTNRNIVN